MTLANKKELYGGMIDTLSTSFPSNWKDINSILLRIKDSVPLSSPMGKGEFLQLASRGTAFITFDYGIDGVSIEFAKYAQSLETLFEGQSSGAIHFIGGDFYSQADSVLESDWQRFRIRGINGWDKWDDGKWFAALFYNDMPEGSSVSNTLAVEIYRQAVSIAEQLGGYLADNDISLLIPINIASNPGNLALTLALIFVTEAMGIYVINSNHDFYWDGGKPASKREPGDPPGIRDHFFRNVDNEPFFSLFESMYPWNGRRWLQVNINRIQSGILIHQYGFPEDQVFELSTCVSNEFFESYTQEDVKLARLRMGHILSGGESIIHPIPIDAHIVSLSAWMKDQTPRVLGARAGLTLDPTTEGLIYMLQATRIVARKRIERDLYLIKALLQHQQFRDAFEKNEAVQLVLHITGPTPIEHQADHERVLQAYVEVIQSVPASISDRIFLALSVGYEDHLSLQANNFSRLSIEDIYRMATVIVFPSEAEGRGLPIIESSACGVPIICSRYTPEEAFADVVGEGLSSEQQIRYTLFPEGDFSESTLDEVTNLLLHPELNQERNQHNKEAVRSRYRIAALRETFRELLDHLRRIK